MLNCNICDLASEGADIIMHQLKSIYNSPFKDLHSYLIHTCLPMIASNVVENENKIFFKTLSIFMLSSLRD